MNKELQDLAWSVLPKEFKEEVKKIYSALLANIKMYRGDNPEQVGTTDPILWERTLGIKNTLCRLFGTHNLTSDAEGEEMLMVSRKEIQEIYRDADNLRRDPAIPSHSTYWNAQVELLYDLFGFACLPDNVDSPEPNVDSTHDNVDSSEVNVDSLEYLEPKANSDIDIDELVAKGYVPDPAKQFGNILKDGFRNERRLNIAAMMAQAILTRIDDTPQVIAEAAFRHANALFAECEKGGEVGND